MSITVVVNPSSGKGRARRVIPEALQVMRQWGAQPRVVVTTSADDVRSAVARARSEGEDRVVVCGGDGTLHCAVQELAGGTTALAVIPAGTGDDNARTLGIPRDDVAGAARIAVAGAVDRVDLGHVTAADGTQRFILGVMSSGFDSLVNERANRMSWPTGTARYLVAILGELRTFRPVPYLAVLDGVSIEGEAMLVAVGNGASYGGGMRICPAADPTDGSLDITWLHGVKTRTFLRVFPRVFTGTHVDTPYVSTYRAHTVTLDAPGQLAYADGERVGPLPVEVRLDPAALPVVRTASPA